MKKIKHNRFIKVKLTENGKAIYRNHYKTDAYADENGFSKFTLWIFMGIFGEYIHRGWNVLEDGCIYMHEDDLKEEHE